MAPIYVLLTRAVPLHGHAASWLLNLLALAAVLALGRPVWRWVQPRVHHVVYAADDPNMDMLGQLSDVLASAPPDSSLLTAMADIIHQIMNAPYVQLEMMNGATAAVGQPRRGAVRTRIALIYRDTAVGWLTVTSRLPNEALTAGEDRLLHGLARQVSITLHAAQMSDTLQSAREQLVLAREEERRRMRRDLHDGLGPTLAALRLQLSALRSVMRQDLDEADRLLDDLRADVRAATADIRRLVYDLRPPMLDEFGLAGALRNLQVTHPGLTRIIDAPERAPALPAAVEVAIYRIAAEALHNIVRHADAEYCVVHLAVSETAITLTVRDNGRGLPPDYLAGVGHRAMHERAAELGGSVTMRSVPTGGTCIQAIFPLQAAPHG